MITDEFTEAEAVAITIIHYTSGTFYIGVDLSSCKIHRKYKISVFSDKKDRKYKTHYVEVFNDKMETKRKYESLIDQYLKLIDQQLLVKRYGSSKF